MDEYAKFRDDDPIARLIVHYFYPTDLMFRHFNKLRIELNAGTKKETINNLSNEGTYLQLWLGSLYAVVEGFEELNLYDNIIEELLSQRRNGLRLYRNGTFHYQSSHTKQTNFLLERDSIEWAEKLHHRLAGFFSEYSSEIAVQAILADMGQSPNG